MFSTTATIQLMHIQVLKVQNLNTALILFKSQLNDNF